MPDPKTRTEGRRMLTIGRKEAHDTFTFTNLHFTYLAEVKITARKGVEPASHLSVINALLYQPRYSVTSTPMALMFTDSPDVAALSVISYLNIE